MKCVCQGKGFVLSTNEQGYAEIQKCDDCQIFEDDSEVQTYIYHSLIEEE